MERKGDTIRALSKEGLITFGSLIVKWEQNNEPPPSAVIKPAEDISNSATPTSKYVFLLYYILEIVELTFSVRIILEE